MSINDMEAGIKNILPNLFKKKEQNKLRNLLYVAISPEHLGLSYNDIRDMPIYILMQLMEEHDEIIRKKNKEIKKASKK